MKMINIRTDISTFLKSKHPDLLDKARVHAEEAPDDAIYPYIVYDLPNSVKSSDMENFVFELDFWDKNTDTTELETLCALVNEGENGLDGRTLLITETLGVTFHLEGRRQLKDSDKRLRRRQYVYQVRVHGA
ncbi:tail completion protein gp17 [Salipaludibacillus sp. CF4.18]|uniref:tail completion protein gp17 n=1 Tax=Salipaludibacillus sp. CF4.18 TaxID=3373081 RepID=UPI003EE4E671